MTTCFLSYASPDRVMVQGLANSLQSHRYEVWMDVASIPGGSEWEHEINKAIAQSEIFLIVVTPDATKSEWVKREIELARKLDKPIFPLLMREIALEDELKDLGIDNLQYINSVQSGFSPGLEDLLKALPPIFMSENQKTGSRALVIEDQEIAQFTIQQILENMGVQVVTANAFDIALKLIRQERFDLITLDMQLDVMDPGGQRGLILLDQLRVYQRDVPVIIITALEWKGKDVRDFLREYEAFDFLSKPFKPGDLRPIVEKALGNKLV